MAVMLVLLSIDLEALLEVDAQGFQCLRVICAAYLLSMAWQSLMTDITATPTLEAKNTLRKMARSVALVVFTNPKLILIFYAFFPQFIDPETAAVPQVAVMGGTFILIEVAAIALCAYGRNWVQTKLEDAESSKWLSRLTVTASIAAAGLILLP